MQNSNEHDFYDEEEEVIDDKSMTTVRSNSNNGVKSMPSPTKPIKQEEESPVRQEQQLRQMNSPTNPNK